MTRMTKEESLTFKLCVRPLGGPGAVFWMWVAAILGAATKFTEISLALFNRKIDPEDGMVHGGPMYTIKNGMGKSFIFLGYIYAIFVMLSAFGAGNMFQSNQMSSLLEMNAGIPTWISGLVFAILAGLVLIGGIKRIGQVASTIVPVMVVLYFGTAVVGLFLTGTAAVGGFSGVAFREVLAQGIRRAVFSNEAGMGSSAIAHSAAKSSPIQEGIVGSLEPYIDTIIVCTVTALVLLITGVWSDTGGNEGSMLTAMAFSSQFGPIGAWIVTISVVFFSFSTIISWSYYGEQGVNFVFGKKWIMPYRYVFIIFTFIGSLLQLTTVLNFSDAVFGLLAIPNLFASIYLAPKLKKALETYEMDLSLGKIKKFK
jgi:alanine or glycine:cation symporter, AGCS family